MPASTRRWALLGGLSKGLQSGIEQGMNMNELIAKREMEKQKTQQEQDMAARELYLKIAIAHAGGTSFANGYAYKSQGITDADSARLSAPGKFDPNAPVPQPPVPAIDPTAPPPNVDPAAPPPKAAPATTQLPVLPPQGETLGGFPVVHTLGKTTVQSNVPVYWYDPESQKIYDAQKNEVQKSTVPKGAKFFNMATGQTLDLQRERLAWQKEKATLPTAATRSMGEIASTISPHITEMRNLIDEANQAGYIGPVAGRVYGQFLAGQVGSTGDPKADEMLGKLRTEDSLVKTAMMRSHFGARGGQQMYDKFSALLNTGNQSKEMLNGALDTFDNFAKGYTSAAGIDTESVANGGAASMDMSSLHRRSPKNAPAANQAGMITIKASDGSVHTLPAANLNAARQRDPGLQVVQ